MDSRLSFLKPLIEYLRKCPELSYFKNCRIITKSEYNKIDEDTNLSKAMFIIPLEAKVKNQPKYANHGPCSYTLIQSVLVAIFVDCALDQRNEISVSEINDDEIQLYGAYPQAEKHEVDVIKCINCFNDEYFDNQQLGTRLFLKEMPAPDEFNGKLILPLLYEREFTIGK